MNASIAKNYIKSAKTSAAWKSKRYSFMAGIKKFHRSTKGKRVQRNLARLHATRIMVGRRTRRTENPSMTAKSRREALIVISSMKTHVMLEQPERNEELNQFLDAVLFEEYALEQLHIAEVALYCGEDMPPDSVELLLRICTPTALQTANSDYNATEDEGTHAMTKAFYGALLAYI